MKKKIILFEVLSLILYPICIVGWATLLMCTPLSFIVELF